MAARVPNARRAWVAAVTVLTLVGAVVPLLVAGSLGALAIPRSDDWSYLLTLFGWAEHGRWQLNDWTSMTLVGQIALTAPIVKIFGASITAVHVFSALLGVGGLVALWALARRLGLGAAPALLVATTIAVGPMWISLAPTFMTDIPAFAFQALALALAARALNGARLSTGWLTASTASALLAFAIRQYALPTLAAILVTAIAITFDTDQRALRRAVALATVAGAAVIAISAWWLTLPGRLPLDVVVPTASTIERAVGDLAGFLRLAGLLLLPVIVYARPYQVVRRAWDAGSAVATVATISTVALLVLGDAIDVPRPFVGNYVSPRGVLGDVSPGSRPLLMPPVVFDLLVVAGSLAALIVVLAAIPAVAQWSTARRLPSRREHAPLEMMVVLAGAGGALILVAASVFGLPVFDRYGLTVVALVGLLLGRSAARTTPVATRNDRAPTALVGASLVGLGLLGLVFATESASYDAARWQVAEAVVRAGFAPADIDAGYEWGGFRRRVAPPFNMARDLDGRRRKMRRYVAGTCIAVVIRPPKGAGIVADATTADGLLRRPARVAAVPTSRPCADGRVLSPAVRPPSDGRHIPSGMTDSPSSASGRPRLRLRR